MTIYAWLNDIDAEGWISLSRQETLAMSLQTKLE
jgi:hypothetical protein